MQCSFAISVCFAKIVFLGNALVFHFVCIILIFVELIDSIISMVLSSTSLSPIAIINSSQIGRIERIDSLAGI